MAEPTESERPESPPSAGPRAKPRRRGANAVEFALIAPVLVTMLGGMVDYGWYFWREALVTNALRESARSGAIKKQSTGETGATCSLCVSTATSAATSSLSALGITGATIVPTIQRIPASGTPCSYALVLQPTIAHTRLFPILPGPSNIQVRVVSMAQNLTCT